ncbi:MAG TPA: L-threonylcarbamoyladenylate synthase [Bacteroidales bacterium]|nr:L-threonylcarbamoyladenylate synthase [Bacteroidales bacterium]
MLLKIYPDNPNPKHINRVVEVLKNGGLIIYPTDSVYGLGCDIYNQKAVERVARLKGKNPEDADFSFIVSDLSNLSEYTKMVDNSIFKLMKKNLPGPFTFILHASSKVPKIFKNKKKTIGLRIPDNPVIREIVAQLGNPILTTSIHDDDDVVEYTTDPELIHEKYQELVDIVIDGGYGNNQASTVIDCTGDEPEMIRQGIGEVQA